MIRRSKLEVFGDIMKVVAQEGEIRRTRIMYKANLAWKVLREALDVMEKKGILKNEERAAGVFVTMTPNGYAVLRRFAEVENIFLPEFSTAENEVFASRVAVLS